MHPNLAEVAVEATFAVIAAALSVFLFTLVSRVEHFLRSRWGTETE